MSPSSTTPVAAKAPVSAARKKLRRREALAGYAFLTPWLIGFLGLTAGPMIASLYLSFTDYNLFSAPEWVGLENYEFLFKDPRYLQACKVTLIYVLLGMPIKFVASLAMALLLNTKYRGQGFFRSVFYAPSLIGASVSIAIVWRAMFNDGGIVDLITSSLGWDTGGWVGNPDFTMPMFILLAVWTFGAPMVIFLAGLKDIPVVLYEAAQIDGANWWGQFRNITLPMLSPVIFFNLLLEMIGAFQIFGSAYIISNGTGGPAGSTLFYTLYLYQRAFEDYRMGYASAMAWVLVIVIGLIAMLMFRSSNSWVHYGGDAR